MKNVYSRVIFSSIFLLLNVFSAFPNHNRDTITIGGVYYDNVDTLSGYLPSMLQAIMAEMDLNYQIIPLPTVTSREVREQDLAACDVFMTGSPQNAKSLGTYCSLPYLSVEQSVIFRDDKPYEDLFSLFDSKIVVKEGSSSYYCLKSYFAETNKADYAQIELFTDELLAFKLLDLALVDYIIMPTMRINYFSEMLQSRNFKVSDVDITPMNLCFISHNEELIAQIDKAIQGINSSDTPEQLMDKWLIPSAENKSQFLVAISYVLLFVFVAILFYLLVVLYNKFLQERVRIKEMTEVVKSLDVNRDLTMLLYDFPNQTLYELVRGEYKKRSIQDLHKDLQLFPESKETLNIYDSKIKELKKETPAFRIKYLNKVTGAVMHYELIYYPIIKKGKVVKLLISRRDISIHLNDSFKKENTIKTLQMALSLTGSYHWRYNLQDFSVTIAYPDVSKGEVTYDAEAIMKLIHPDHFERFNAFLNNMLETSAPDNKISIPIRSIDLDEYKIYDINANVYKDAQDVPIYLHGISNDVTEFENYKKGLEESQSQLQTMIDSLPIPIYIKDPVEQHITYANKEAQQTYLNLFAQEFKPGEVLSWPGLKDNVHEHVKEIDTQICETGNAYSDYETMPMPNGGVVQTLVKKILIDYKGTKQILVARIDLGERRKIERAKSLITASLNHINAFNWTLDGRNNTLTVSNTLDNSDDKSLNSLDDLLMHIHPDDKSEFEKMLTDALSAGEGGFSMTYRTDFSTPGNYEYWQTRIVAERVSDYGEEYSLLFGISININEQKENENLLINNQKKLKQVNKLNELILNNSSSAILFIDKESVIKLSNLDAFQSDRIQFILLKEGVKYSDLSICSDLNILKNVQKAKDEACIAYDKIIFEQYAEAYDVYATPVYGEDGYEGCVVKVDDIWERENMISNLEIAKDKAERSEKMKTAFLANMSHEIRTPLNAIVGFSELVATAEEDEKEEYIKIINDNNEMLLQLIGDILDLSKIESGNIEIKPVRYDFASVISDLKNSWRFRFEEKKLELKVMNPYEHCYVKLDQKLTSQILTNFVSNAFKYTKEGSVKVAYQAKEWGLYVYVQDTGIGIPEHLQSSIFQRFSKLDDFAQGTGLGLSICKALAEKMGGQVGFESVEGEGSKFWFHVPCEIETM